MSNLARQRNEILRQTFKDQCEIYDAEMMVFVDETGCDRRSSMRKFGYVLEGQRARNVRVSAIAAVALDGLRCSIDSVNEDELCDFIERYLLPHLLPFNPRSVVVLDNAAIHHTRRPIELIQSVGALVHFLPPYSPDLNPIEEIK